MADERTLRGRRGGTREAGTADPIGNLQPEEGNVVLALSVGIPIVIIAVLIVVVLVLLLARRRR
jgi:hypothetical protein